MKTFKIYVNMVLLTKAQAMDAYDAELTYRSYVKKKFGEEAIIKVVEVVDKKAVKAPKEVKEVKEENVTKLYKVTYKFHNGEGVAMVNANGTEQATAAFKASYGHNEVLTVVAI